MTLWGGAFSQPTDDLVRRLNDSLRFDWRFYDVDIRGSMAWAAAITDAGVLTPVEREILVEGLERVRAEFATGTFVAGPGDEDIHTAVERRLGEVVGDVARKLHTGRSRNDQVATDLLLWLIDAQAEITSLIGGLAAALFQKAEQCREILMPGYTHFQPAQPLTAAHWWMSHFWALTRDVERLERFTQSWREKCPLGSGALAGTGYAIDREKLAASLGFTRASANSLDSVADRDHVVEFLFAAALLGIHLSRLAEDLIIFANPLFNFVRLDQRFSTGSSIMPQKRNPDPLELTRGKAGRLIGHLAGLLTTLKGLPSGYNKDIQEDKEPLFDSYETLTVLLPTLIGLINTITVNAEPMCAALDPAILATDLADYLVHRGIPFRQAHHISGQAVQVAESKGVGLAELTVEDYRSLSDAFADDVAAVFNAREAVARRAALGGTGDWDAQSKRAQQWLAQHHPN